MKCKACGSVGPGIPASGLCLPCHDTKILTGQLPTASSIAAQTRPRGSCVSCHGDLADDSNPKELICNDCFFKECLHRGAWPSIANDRQLKVLAHGTSWRIPQRKKAANIAEQKAANPVMTHNFGAVCPDTDEHGLEAMRLNHDTSGAPVQRLYGVPVCDCGAKKTGTTHANWCSTKR